MARHAPSHPALGDPGSAPAPSAWLSFSRPLALRSLTREVTEVASGDTLVYATGDRSGLPVELAALAPGMAVQVFPQGKSDNERNLIALVRLRGRPAGGAGRLQRHLHPPRLYSPAAVERAGLHRLPVSRQHLRSRDAAAVVRGPANRPSLRSRSRFCQMGGSAAAGGFEGPVGPV